MNAQIQLPAKGTINTVAGNGTAGFSGDGGLATNAEINTPNDVATDPAGNLYIADEFNNRIRKVTAGTGKVSTVAGDGGFGYNGDGIAATSAALSSPTGVAVDASGNIYIADATNYRIRKVTASTGIISTVAGDGVQGYSGDGGAATSAELNLPVGVAVDSSGNVYIADDGSNRIRKVTASTGNISTLAGNGTGGYSGDGGAATGAELNGPFGVAVDASGNVYIADELNSRIRKVTASTGKISTVAGDGTTGFSGDGGPATSAELFGPYGVALDTAGNIYIGEAGNDRIRKVTASTGIISTVAGNGTEGYTGDGGLATSAELKLLRATVDRFGAIYIADQYNNRIRTVGQGFIQTVAGNGTAGYSGDGSAAISAELDNPYAAAVDTSGNIYIADGDNRIRRVTGPAGIISTVAGNGTGGYSGDGGPATNAELNAPEGLAVDASGNIYIADHTNHRIRKVTVSTGIISTVAGNGTGGYSGDGGLATSAEIRYPEDVAVDAAGNIYIADSFNNRIRKVTVSTGIISTVAGNGTLGFSGDGGAATSAELDDPIGVAVDAAGNIYIADQQNERIRKVTVSTGIISTVAGNGTAGYNGDGIAATTAELHLPDRVEVDASGNIFIADSENSRVRKVTASTGKISTLAGNGTFGYSGDGGVATSSELKSPVGLALDGSGKIFIVDSNGQRVRVVSP